MKPLVKSAFWIKSGLLSALCLMPLSSVNAGFEWVPPTSNVVKQAPQVRSVEPAPTTMPSSPTQPVLAEPIAPTLQDSQMRAPQTRAPETRNASMRPVTGAPSMVAPSVTNAPSNIPAPVMPSTNNTAARAMPAPVAAPQTGLYINPYPLQGNNMQVERRGVDIAMNERGGALTPVQLGNGMTSGVMSPRAPEVRDPIRKPNTTTNYNRRLSSSDLTPMMGGEPAPMQLDGMPQGIFDAPQTPPTTPTMATPQWNSNVQYAKAVGFGKQLPLSLALSQVIPSEYSYRFEGDVNTDANVSWEGGQSWNLVLQDMLRNQNLKAFIQGNQVVIAPSASI